VIHISEGWDDLAAALIESGLRESVYIMGATDTGKTTLCRYLLSRTSAHVRTGCVDCDTGQSWIGPPTTEGMTIHPGPSKPVLRFVGSTSPRGHLVQTLTGAKRLVERALEDGARITLIDSPGLVHGGVGIEFQIQMIDLLRPERIIALQRGRELEGVLANFARHPTIQTHRFPVSPAVAPRTAAERRRYREERFTAYFAGAQVQEIALRGPGLQGRVPDPENRSGVAGRLVSLNDPENFVIVLGIVRAFDPKGRTLTVFAPPFDTTSVASVRFGSVSLDLEAPPGAMECHRFEASTQGQTRARPHTPPPGLL